MNKRILSLTLALIMILGAFTSVFAAETVETKEADFLNKEGILIGNTEGDLELDKVLSRRDSVVLFARLMGEAEEAAKTETSETVPTWTDVRTDAYYVPFFAWAEETGLYNGKETGLFEPHAEMTQREYTTVVLRALGHEQKAAYDNAEKLGKENNLFENTKYDAKAPITRGEVAIITYNGLNAQVVGENKTLAEKLGIEMPEAAELKIESVSTDNLAEIVVELSNAKLVKQQDQLLNAANYRLEKTDAKVHNVHLEGNNVVLTLVPYGKVEGNRNFEVLKKGQEFDLVIRNIDPKINVTEKKILAVDNTIPAVESVEFIGTHGIKVVTNEPIANLQERDFRLEKRTSMLIEQYGRDIILTPYHNQSFDKNATELTIDQLSDFARYKSVKTVESMELTKDEAAPKVTSAYRTGSKLVLEFDKDIYYDSVKGYESRRELGNVSFSDRRVEFNAKDGKKVDTNKAEYVFEREIPKNIEVRVEGVKNHFEIAMEKEVVTPVDYKDEFAPEIINNTKMKNVEVNVFGENRIKAVETHTDKKENEKAVQNLLNGSVNKFDTQEMKIEFDKDIYEFKNMTVAQLQSKVNDYFKVYHMDASRRGQSAASDVKVIIEDIDTKNDTIKVSFKDIKVNNKDKDFDYVLEVRNLTDMNGNRMDRQYVDFQVVRIGNAFNAIGIKVMENSYWNRNGIEIRVSFNEYVNKESASNENNYFIDNKTKVDEAIVENDGKTVSLVIYTNDSKAKFLNDNNVLEISPAVKDLSSPAKSATNRFWNLKTETSIGNGPSTASSAITYVNSADNTVKYTDEVKLNVGSNLNTISVILSGKAQDTAQVVVYDKAGNVVTSLVDSLLIPANATSVTKALTSQALVAGDEFTVVTKAGNREAKLVVKAVDTAKIVDIVYNEDNSIKLNNVVADGTLVLPYGVNVNSLPLSAFEITAQGKATATSTKTEDMIFITVTAENGTQTVYKITLEAQVITTVTATAPTAGNTVTVKVEDQQSTAKVIKGIEAAKFSVKSGTSGSEVTNAVTNVVDNGDGTYTLTLETALVTGNSVIVTVGTILATAVTVS